MVFVFVDILGDEESKNNTRKLEEEYCSVTARHEAVCVIKHTLFTKSNHSLSVAQSQITFK